MSEKLPVKRSPDLYETSKGIVDTHVDEIVPTIIDKMEWGTKELILDHGCGSGSTGFKHFVPIAEKTDSTIYALDNCKSMIEYASKHFENPRIKYVAGELTGTPSPLGDLKFNKIFSIYTLHFIQEYKAELKALYEILEPNGEMFMLISVNSHIFDLFAKVKEHERWGQHAEYHLVVPEWLDEEGENSDVLKNNFENLGFEIKYFTFKEKTYNFPKPEELSNLWFSMNSFAIHLPDHDDVKDHYHGYISDTETKTHVPHEESHKCEYTWHYDALHILVKKPGTGN